MTLDLTGSCLCGAIRYQVSGESPGLVHCHCGRCRKHTGAVVATFCAFGSGESRWLCDTQQVRVYRHDVAERGFCGICGSTVPVPSSTVGPVWFSLAGNHPDMPPPRAVWHLFTNDRMPWCVIPPDAEQWGTVAPEFVDRDPHLGNLVRPTEAHRFTGSCLCGDVSYATNAHVRMVHCHCSRCRLSRAGAFATNVIVRGEDFEWLSGVGRVRDYRLPGARIFGTTFCDRCGSLVPSARNDYFNIPAGGLDGWPEGTAPTDHIFTGSQASWWSIADDLPQWPERVN